MSNNGLELHAVVAEDQHERFHAGTRYGLVTWPLFGAVFRRKAMGSSVINTRYHTLNRKYKEMVYGKPGR
jgi:hypothetical protein